MSIYEIKAAATGLEKAFLLSIGLTEQNLNGKHQPCPGCGGKDRYRSLEDGGYFCSGGGSLTNGDWISHVMHALNIETREVLKLAEDYFGLKEMPKKERQELKARAEKEQKKIKTRARRKDHIAQRDLELEHMCDNLIWHIKEHGAERVLSKEEKKLGIDLVELLVSRYV